MNAKHSVGVPLAALLIGSLAVAGMSATPTTRATAAGATRAAAAPATNLPSTATATHVPPTATATATHVPPTVTIAPKAAITVSPTTVRRGNPISVSGSGFVPNEKITIDIIGRPVSAMITAGPTGAFPATNVTIASDLAPGTYTVSVSGLTSKHNVTAQITVQLASLAIRVAPTTVRQGDTISVSGSGFASSEKVTINIIGTPLLVTVMSNASGIVPTTVVTIPPDIAPGTHTISVTGLTSKRDVTAQIMVQPPVPITTTIAITPTVTNRGGLVIVTGKGFTPSEKITINIIGTPLLIPAMADATGMLPPTGLSIPYSLTPGTYTISVTGLTSKHDVTQQLTVQKLTPSITLAATTVSPNNTVTVTGQGFGRQEQVTLSLNGQALVTSPTVITTSNGAFTATFAVPGSLFNGANTVSAIGNESRVSAVANLTGVLPQAAQFYFAGGLNSATEHSVIQMLNTNAQPATVQLTFYLDNGGVYNATAIVPAHAQKIVPVTSFGLQAHTFGLRLQSDRQVAAQMTVARDGQDGDTLLGNTGLGRAWYLAEGFTGLTFHETVSILNPDPARATAVQLQLLPFGGRPGRTVTVNVPAHTNSVVDINSLLPGQSLSIVATSDLPVVVERTMTFSNGGYGMTMRSGSNVAAGSWLFAEGTTVNRFETFLTILNPGDIPATVSASFFSRTGSSLGSRTLLVPGRSRANIKLNDILSASGVASVVTSNQPVVVERPEYFGSPNGYRIAGSDVFGRNGAGVRWTFPAGNTNGRSEFLLVYNPSGNTVNIRATFYGSNGQTLTRDFSVAPTVRYNVDVNATLPGFDPTHGTVLQSMNGVGFVAEQTVFAPDYSSLRSTQGLAQ